MICEYLKHVEYMSEPVCSIFEDGMWWCSNVKDILCKCPKGIGLSKRYV